MKISFSCFPPRIFPAALLATAVFSARAAVNVWPLDGHLASYTNGPPLIAAGFTPAYTAESFGSVPGTVLDVPALPPAQSLRIPNNYGPNGGGTKTNVWTLVMDVKTPAALPTWLALLQTNT